MESGSLNYDAFWAAALGICGFLLGLLGLVVRSERFAARCWVAAASVAYVAAAVVCEELGQSRAVWLPALMLACGCMLLLVIEQFARHQHQSPGADRFGWRIATWGTVLIAGPAFAVASWQQPSFDTVLQAADLATEASAAKKYLFPPLAEIQPSPALTDLKNPIRLFTVRPEDMRYVELIDEEAALIRAFVLPSPQGVYHARLIQSAPADPAYNCHGWIFAAGRYLIVNQDVPRIILDNGYQRVSDPKPGDIILYRDDAGHCIHSGLVRLVDSGALVLVESKWGGCGRYIHPPEIQPYGTRWDYCRSSRNGHLLRGLGGDQEVGDVDVLKNKSTPPGRPAMPPG